ncbi:hypothetical protein Mcup_1044 [Metallosphaera cuprina Ar-4]|uniref:Uncharacterized protein n=1 Tax=Metallosphaera cuprina (strain Ar-4) TaxID=1006006 RepID=F4G2V1_METCR|nr:hypothetical protein Mcup_1044 [Metallosphaera cuprina Ar-4]
MLALPFFKTLREWAGLTLSFPRGGKAYLSNFSAQEISKTLK